MAEIHFPLGYIKGIEKELRMMNIMQSQEFFIKIMFAHFEYCHGVILPSEIDRLIHRYNAALPLKHDCLYRSMSMIGDQCKWPRGDIDKRLKFDWYCMMSRVKLARPFSFGKTETLVFSIQIREVDDLTVQFLTDRVDPASRAINKMYCPVNSPTFKSLLELAYELEEILTLNHWLSFFRLYKMRSRIIKESKSIFC